MNLVVNARDAMPRGGTIEIRTLMRHFAEPLHRDRAVVTPADWVEVRVTDSGTGMSTSMEIFVRRSSSAWPVFSANIISM
jgi:signal transduction histidine kinase